jgi:hypothetical protein
MLSSLGSNCDVSRTGSYEFGSLGTAMAQNPKDSQAEQSLGRERVLISIRGFSAHVENL